MEALRKLLGAVVWLAFLVLLMMGHPSCRDTFITIATAQNRQDRLKLLAPVAALLGVCTIGPFAPEGAARTLCGLWLFACLLVYLAIVCRDGPRVQKEPTSVVAFGSRDGGPESTVWLAVVMFGGAFLILMAF